MSNAPIYEDVIDGDGTVIVFSDAHYWPGEVTTAHRGLVKLCKVLKPALVVANGDMLDGARISKHQRIGWERSPKVRDELDVCKQRLGEVAKAAGYVPLIWPLGNHDARFETYVSNKVPEYSGVDGFSLRDHFPAWTPCWQCRINSDVVIKHRWKGGSGASATYNNVMKAGVSIVTGHLHSSKTTPYTNYAGTHFGVDCGTLADPLGPQFTAYTETNPNDWRSGLVVLTFRDGKLLWPEHVHVIDEQAGELSFRGQVLRV